MLNSKELDAQSPVKIDQWVDLDSQEFKSLNHKYPQFTKDILRLGICEMDDLGRLWGEGKCYYYPLHDEYDGKLVGYRVAKKAAN